jgi:hypothetical protein
MSIANLGDIDNKLTEMYADEVTTNATKGEYVDKSHILFEQMQMIAMVNKSFLGLK